MRGAILLLIAMAAGGAAQSPSDFAGTWVLHFQGKNLMVLTLKVDGDKIAGTVVRPATYNSDSDGYFEKISASHSTTALEKCALVSGRLEFTLDEDPHTFALTAKDRGAMTPVLDNPMLVMMPWTFERSPHPRVVVSSDWSEPHYPADIVAVQQRLVAMVKEDQEYRNPRSLTFDPRVVRVDRKHRPELLKIFAKYDWPTYSMMGKQAADQFWLLVQHQDLKMQLKMLPALEKAVTAGQASMKNYAFLYDNIQVAQGKLQRWGIKLKSGCENGKPAILPVEDPAHLDERRKQIGLMPIEHYLKLFEPGCKPPAEPRP